MLNLACHREPQEIDAILMELVEGDAQAMTDCHVSSAEMGTRYQAAIRQGLAVDRDITDRLNAIAEAILVAATEQSRRGAGEA